MGAIPYRLIFDAATQPIVDRVFVGVFVLIIVVSAICILAGQRMRLKYGVAILSVMVVGGFAMLGISIHNRMECKQWARSGDYQIAEGVVENFVRTRHSGNKGSSYTIETFTVQRVGFRCKSGIDVFNGGFHETESPVNQGVQVKIAYKNERILKLWVADGNG